MPGMFLVFKRMLASALVIVVFLGGLFFSLWDFSRQASSDTRENVSLWLRQTAEQCAETLHSRLHEKLAALEIMADYFATLDDLMDWHAMRFLSVVSSHQSIRRVSVITPDGTAHSVNGVSANVSDRDYFQRSIKGESNISTLLESKYDGSEVFMVSVPIIRENKVIGALGGCFLPVDLQHSVNIKAFGGKGSTLLLERDGDIVLRSERDPFSLEKNLFSLAGNSPERDGTSLEDLQRDMGTGHSGVLRYVYNGDVYYMCYIPLKINDWYVLSLVPGDFIDEQIDQNRQLAILLSVRIVILSLMVFLYIWYVRHNDAKIFYNKSRELQTITDNLVGGVLKSDSSEKLILEYMSTGYLNIMEYSRNGFFTRFGDSLIETVIEEDRPRVVRELQEQLLKNETICLEFRSKTRRGRTIWLYYKGHLVQEGGKRWCYALVVDITQQHELAARERLANERYRFIMEQNSIVMFDWSILEDKITASAGLFSLLGNETSLFRASSLFFSHVHPEDRKDLEELFRNLSHGMEKGMCEARLAFSPNRYDWYRIKAGTVFDASGLPERVIGVLIDIDTHKKLEFSLREQAEKDGHTGLYNKETTQRLVESLLHDGKRTPESFAFMIIDLDKFKDINDTRGHDVGDMVIRHVAAMLKAQFRRSDIVGRIGGDEFAVCLVGLADHAIIAEKAASLIREGKKAFDGFPEGISLSIGVALCPEDDTNYRELYRKADEAMYLSKRKGRQSVSFYGDIAASDRTGSVPD